MCVCVSLLRVLSRVFVCVCVCCLVCLCVHCIGGGDGGGGGSVGSESKEDPRHLLEMPRQDGCFLFVSLLGLLVFVFVG